MNTIGFKEGAYMAIDISKLRVNKNSPIPLYYQLKQGLLAQIHFCKSGDALPTENKIVDALGISRPTVRQSFNELAKEGYIYREIGRGTFVLNPKAAEEFLQKLDGFDRAVIGRGLTPSTRILDSYVMPSCRWVNDILNLAYDENLIYLCRLRYADGEPLVYQESYLPQKKFDGLEKENLTDTSVYEVLEEKYTCKVERATRKIEAKRATHAESELLWLRPSAPIILVRHTLYDESGQPIEHSLTRHRGDKNIFTEELKR